MTATLNFGEAGKIACDLYFASAGKGATWQKRDRDHEKCTASASFINYRLMGRLMDGLID
jgi:hypothetical protein